MEDGRLVVGLGNPGPEYARTRHNIGFMVLDELLSLTGGYGWQEKFLGEFNRTRVARTPAILLKPMTFMNLSGRSVARAVGFHRFSLDDLIVIHDDLDLDFGAVKVKVGGGTGGHKGLASCKKELGSAEFLRVRVGIGRPRFGNASKFVLESFSEDEQSALTEVIARAAKAVESVVTDGPVKAMNQFNQRQGDSHES